MVLHVNEFDKYKYVQNLNQFNLQLAYLDILAVWAYLDILAVWMYLG